MARVTVEDCIDKVENRFELVLLAGHRGRMISSGAQITIDRDNDKNPVVALREIADETISPGDLKEDLIHSLQKYVEVDEPEPETATSPAALFCRTSPSPKRPVTVPPTTKLFVLQLTVTLVTSEAPTERSTKRSTKARRRSNQSSFSAKPGKLALRPLGFGTTKTRAPAMVSRFAPGPGPVAAPKYIRYRLTPTKATTAGRQRAIQREFDGGRLEGAPVMKAHAAFQVKCIGQPVIRDFPRSGKLGHD